MDKHPGLAIFTDTVNHHCEIRLDSIESVDDCAQLPFESIHTRPQTLPILGDWSGELGWATSMQNCGDVLRMPAQCSGECLQGPRASASLNDVMLNFANGRSR